MCLEGGAHGPEAFSPLLRRSSSGEGEARGSTRSQADRVTENGAVPTAHAGVVTRSLAVCVDTAVVVLATVAVDLATAGIRFVWSPMDFRWPRPSWELAVLVLFGVAVVYLTVGWSMAGRTYGAPTASGCGCCPGVPPTGRGSLAAACARLRAVPPRPALEWHQCDAAFSPGPRPRDGRRVRRADDCAGSGAHPRLPAEEPPLRTSPLSSRQPTETEPSQP